MGYSSLTVQQQRVVFGLTMTEVTLDSILLIFGVYIFIKHIMKRYKTFPLFAYYVLVLLFLCFRIPCLILLNNPLQNGPYLWIMTISRTLYTLVGLT